MAKNMGKRSEITRKIVSLHTIMDKSQPLLIDFRHLQQCQKPIEQTLDDAFFKELDQDDIIGGNVSIKLTLRELSEDDYKLRIEIEGEAELRCDRCLEPTRMAVNVDENVFFTFNPESTNQDAEFLSERQATYDLSWLIFELIDTSLPPQRFHKEGECAPDMLSRISGSVEGDEDEGQNDEII